MPLRRDLSDHCSPCSDSWGALAGRLLAHLHLQAVSESQGGGRHDFSGFRYIETGVPVSGKSPSTDLRD